jgi:hypothetical protein
MGGKYVLIHTFDIIGLALQEGLAKGSPLKLKILLNL